MTDTKNGSDAPSKAKRGFASMNAETQRAIASRGGKAAHAAGTAYEWHSETAKVAGRKGGLGVARDKAHMAEIGRKGGLKRAANAAKRAAEASSAEDHTTYGAGRSYP